jgi:hypothetical protein
MVGEAELGDLLLKEGAGCEKGRDRTEGSRGEVTADVFFVREESCARRATVSRACCGAVVGVEGKTRTGALKSNAKHCSQTTEATWFPPRAKRRRERLCMIVWAGRGGLAVRIVARRAREGEGRQKRTLCNSKSSPAFSSFFDLPLSFAFLWAIASSDLKMR